MAWQKVSNDMQSSIITSATYSQCPTVFI